MMARFRAICGSYKTHAGWSLTTVATVITILSLLGLLPWATRAELTEHKADLSGVIGRMAGQIDALYHALGAPDVIGGRRDLREHREAERDGRR